MKRILLTGASGFIGRSLLEHLSGRFEVLAPGHAQLDLTDAAVVESYLVQNPVDVIVHGATKPGHRNAVDVSRLLEANTRMYLNLTRSRELCPKMVLLSTGAVYDPVGSICGADECALGSSVPSDEASYSKYVVARIAERDPRVTELRLFGVFGPGEDYAIRFISNAICKALVGLPITLRQDRVFDYLWVGDLGRIVEHFVDSRGTCAAYNVTPDEPVSLYDVARIVQSQVNPDVPILVGKPGRGPEYTGNNSRLRAEMPDISFTPILSAVEMLRDWYSEKLDEIDLDLLREDR